MRSAQRTLSDEFTGADDVSRPSLPSCRAMRFSVQAATHAGHEAVRLADTASELEALFLPTLGMLGASLRHRGEELLGLHRRPFPLRVEGLDARHPAAPSVGEPSRRIHVPGGRSLGRARSRLAAAALEEHGLAIHGVVGPRLPLACRGATRDSRRCHPRRPARVHNGGPARRVPLPHALGRRSRSTPAASP